eukprot:TRINITY_DN19942_c0_g1_i1.p1 TRINITY_DN19942_c0_g1~~TRINITY_DN19942_c0_g1_i1.p1  ORF type:complete len:441 (+),score=145.69 TRINITY_DN19942_c0_g1_i1:55-1323(+)
MAPRAGVWLHRVVCLALLVCAAGRVVVVGDLHGDLPTARSILQAAKVVDEDGVWIAPAGTTLLQTGDIVDRGPDSHGIMDLFMDMKEQAERAGSTVVNLIGNHEWMNLSNDWSFVHPGEIEAFGGVAGRVLQWSEHGRYGAWVRNNPMIHAIGSTVFCHAGIMPQYAEFGIDVLNQKTFNTVRGAGDGLSDTIWSEYGPVWTRDIVWPAQEGHCANLEEALRKLSAAEGREFKRMVVGHSIQPGGKMSFLCNEKLVAIDVGVSVFYNGGYVTYLEVLNALDETAFSASQVSLPKRDEVEGVRVSRPRWDFNATRNTSGLTLTLPEHLPRGYTVAKGDLSVHWAAFAPVAPPKRRNNPIAAPGGAPRRPGTDHPPWPRVPILVGCLAACLLFRRGRMAGSFRGAPAAEMALLAVLLVFGYSAM